MNDGPVHQKMRIIQFLCMYVRIRKKAKNTDINSTAIYYGGCRNATKGIRDVIVTSEL